MSEYRPLSTSIAPCCSGSLFFSPCLYVFPYVWFTFYLAFLHSARVPNLHLIHFFTPFPRFRCIFLAPPVTVRFCIFFLLLSPRLLSVWLWKWVCLSVFLSVSLCPPLSLSLSLYLLLFAPHHPPTLTPSPSPAGACSCIWKHRVHSPRICARH